MRNRLAPFIGAALALAPTFAMSACARPDEDEIAVVPRPAQVTRGRGAFTFGPRTVIHADRRAEPVARFGKEGTFWTLEYAAQVSFEEGITERRVTGETIRTTLDRLGVRWERAKRWIESPDPEYARKKGLATG